MYPLSSSALLEMKIRAHSERYRNITAVIKNRFFNGVIVFPIAEGRLELRTELRLLIFGTWLDFKLVFRFFVRILILQEIMVHGIW